MIKIALLLDFTEEYHKNLLRGIIRYSREHGPWIFLRLPLYYRDSVGVDGLIKYVKEWGAKGLIGQLYSKTEIEKFRKAGISVVAQDFEERFKEVPNISGAYNETGRMGAEYFLKRGFKNFAFYGFKNFVWSRERAEGFEEKINEAGYVVHYYEHRKSRHTDLWYYRPSALSRWLKSLPKPIALMASDDNQALHITEASKHAQVRVPEDIAVMGVDNDENICYLSDPPLSSIHLDIERGGYEAAAVMHKLLTEKKKKFSNIIIKPTAIETRASTNIYSTNDTHIDNALKFIHLNIDRNIKVTHLLDEIPLSRRSLEKRFIMITGLPIYKYIFNSRMDLFAKLLLETDKSIIEIAHQLGLDNTKNITKQFKTLKGITPLEYRKKFKGKDTRK
jgi:LacI family transcriptional regulator